MAAYLWRYDLIEQPTFIAQQGHWLGQPAQATVEVVGGAATIVRGELVL